jgi:hypothetical protein
MKYVGYNKHVLLMCIIVHLCGTVRVTRGNDMFIEGVTKGLWNSLRCVCDIGDESIGYYC